MDEEQDTGKVETSKAEETAKLQAELEAKKREVASWCRSSYGDAFSAWVHICAVRLFVESVLRYGLPPKFLGTIIAPHGKHEQKVRKALAGAFGVHGADFWKADDTGPSDGKDVFPYVSFTLDLDV